MFCTRCGAEHATGSAYCRECGQPLAAQAAPRSIMENGTNPVTAAATWAEQPVRAPVLQPAPAYPPAPTPAYVPAAQPASVAAAYGAAATAGTLPAGMNINITLNQTATAAPAPIPQMPVVMVANQDGPPLIVRALWFVFVGWWVGFLYIMLAWLLNLTILGLPFGLTMINNVPLVMTLKRRTQTTSVTYINGVTYVQQNARPPQAPWLARALYFLVAGWWLSLIWLSFAWLFSVSIIGLPLGFWMFDQVPLITTLARY